MKVENSCLSLLFAFHGFHPSSAFQFTNPAGLPNGTKSWTWLRLSLRTPDTIYLTTSKTWEKRFEELVYFLQENGHCNVARNHGSLGNWVQKQRLSYKLYCIDEAEPCPISSRTSYSSPPQPLSKEQVQLLDEIGFIWDVHEYKYQCNLDELKEFYVRHCHIDVPSSIDGEYRKLYKWLRLQKEEYKKSLNGKQSKMADHRRISLENLGFHTGMFDVVASGPAGYEAKRVSWYGRYQQLLQFKEEYGHCNVPTNDEQHRTLSGWVQHQRAEKKKKASGKMSKLTEDRETKLEAAGFIWSIKEWNWRQRLEDLKRYKQHHGHCNVPTKDGELGGWVMTQRLTYSKSSLPKDRKESLDELGFIYDMHELCWEEKYNELRCQLLDQEGPSQRTLMTGPLNSWITTQRAEKRYKDLGLETHLADEREVKLEAIGFEWDANEEREKNRQSTWMNNFNRLKQQIEDTGSSKVLVDEGGNGFRIWVRDQRLYLKAFENEENGPMTQERRDLLFSIEFKI